MFDLLIVKEKGEISMNPSSRNMGKPGLGHAILTKILSSRKKKLNLLERNLRNLNQEELETSQAIMNLKREIEDLEHALRKLEE